MTRTNKTKGGMRIYNKSKSRNKKNNVDIEGRKALLQQEKQKRTRNLVESRAGKIK